MATLDFKQMSIAYGAAQAMVSEMERNGFRIEVLHDRDEFAEAMASLPNPLGVSRSFEIWSDRAFWMKCVDIESGQLASIRSCDLFETGNLRVDFQSWRRFRKIPPLDWKGMDIETNQLDEIAGLIGFGGSVCTHPEYHRRGLATFLSKITRYLLLGFHGVDYFVGLVETELKARRLGLRQLQLTNSVKVFDGFYPGRDQEMEVSVIWMDSLDILVEAEAYLKCSPSALMGQIKLIA